MALDMNHSVPEYNPFLSHSTVDIPLPQPTFFMTITTFLYLCDHDPQSTIQGLTARDVHVGHKLNQII